MFMKQLFISLLITVAMVSCRVHDGAPKTDHLGPEPAAHNGTFVCDGDTLFFNGDGKSVSWSFSNPVGELTGKGEGSYVFKLNNKSFRYDAAEDFSVYDGKESHTYFTGPGMNTEDQISFYTFVNDERLERTFKKVK